MECIFVINKWKLTTSNLLLPSTEFNEHTLTMNKNIIYGKSFHLMASRIINLNCVFLWVSRYSYTMI